METVTIIILVIEFLLAIILGLIGFIVKDMKQKMTTLEIDMKGMKDNYLTRFATVIKNQNDNHAEIKEILSDMKTQIALLEQKKSTNNRRK